MTSFFLVIVHHLIFINLDRLELNIYVGFMVSHYSTGELICNQCFHNSIVKLVQFNYKEKQSANQNWVCG